MIQLSSNSTEAKGARSTQSRPTGANLASPLCDEATDGEILISQRVLTALDLLVEAESAGDLVLEGFIRPVAADRILRLTEN